MRIWLRFLLLFLAAGLAACGGAVAPEGSQRNESGEKPLMVFAAASLHDVAADFKAEFERRHVPAEVVYNFAGSNTLAQQIHAATGADVFLSADQDWIDFLEQSGRLVAGTRRAFLSNRLVLIARRDSALEIEDPRDLAERGGLRFLALADPRAVPAGRYAQAALENISWHDGSLWSGLEDRIAPALDVRAALALVESDPEIAGIVYQTDAMTSGKVRVLHEFPAMEEAPIRYWVALVASSENPELGRHFLDFLLSPAAREIAERHGFSVP